MPASAGVPEAKLQSSLPQTASIPVSFAEIYKDGEYLRRHPGWHIEESPFKAKYILRLLERNALAPRTISEVGCGAGEVLRLLQLEMPETCQFWGYEISPQAIELSVPRANVRLHFELADFTKQDARFDLLLVLDVIEHVEDYFSFLRAIREKAEHVIFHFPLDISVQAVLRRNGMMKRREEHAHLHYFTKELALAALEDTGYTVVDFFYTPRSNEIGPQLVQKLFRMPRTALFAVRPDMAVRVLGGYTLMVLAKAAG
jgi:SAM-dependent methyltransferase